MAQINSSPDAANNAPTTSECEAVQECLQQKRKLLLCRPQGGMNDMLCQIEIACRYAERTRRTVIVETDAPGALFFKDSLAHYFVSLRKDLILSSVGFSESFDRLPVVPGFLFGRVNAYGARRGDRAGPWLDDLNGKPLAFNFMADYAEPLLVMHTGGGGKLSQSALLRMRIHDSIVDELIERLRKIGTSFSALHIRNTDYKSHYSERLAELSKTICEPVFVATDNADALEDCKAAFGSTRVHSFSELPMSVGIPIHMNVPAGAVARRRNRDALLDLLTLALARELHLFEVANFRPGKYSGFSVLARDLAMAKPLLAKILSRKDPILSRYGI